MKHRVIIIGGGIAGMTTAGAIGNNCDVVILEKEAQAGGHVINWHRLFPSRRNGKEVLDKIRADLDVTVNLQFNTCITSILRHEDEFIVLLDDGRRFTGDVLVLAMGYGLFDASRKEEYGYGIYDHIITSADLETIFREDRFGTILNGQPPRRVAFIHCVGSRDEKVGNRYCSKVCCVTGVKQAIELKEKFPKCEVFSFYMDLRMYDRHFEELYYEAQQKWGIHFIRGRLSECAENPDKTLLLKTEDTLTGRPLKMTVDMMVLLVGFIPNRETKVISEILGLKTGTDGFVLPDDEHTGDNLSGIPGVFLTGAVKGPACIVNTVADARATAQQVLQYLNIKDSL